MKSLVALGFAAIAVLATGCTAQAAPDLPSLGGTRPTAATDIEAVAKAYFDCMSQAGVPVRLEENDAGELTMVRTTGNWYLQTYPQGGGGGKYDDDIELSLDAQARFQEFFENMPAHPTLILDGADHSQAYGKCLEQTNYDFMAAMGEVASDPEQNLKQVKANNDWAACARENGFPAILDSEMPMGTEQPLPVLLPGSITPEQLRALLVTCPNFNKETVDQAPDWWGLEDVMASSNDTDPHPNIEVDHPYWFTRHGPDFRPSEADLSELERMVELQEALKEPQRAYWDERLGETDGNPTPAESPN